MEALETRQEEKTPGTNPVTTRPAVCDKHGPYEQRVFMLSFTGKPIYENCPKCEQAKEAVRQEEAQKHDEEVKARIEANRRAELEEMGIRRRFYETSFDTFLPGNADARRALDTCRDYVSRKDDVTKTGENLFLVGRPGTGKNHLAVSIVREWAGRRKILKLAEMIRDIRQAYSAHTNEQRDIDRFARLDLLVINEVGVQFGTDAEKNLLFEVLDLRYENMLPTILISNLNVQGIKDFVGGRVIDRLLENGTVLEFTWESYRGKK